MGSGNCEVPQRTIIRSPGQIAGRADPVWELGVVSPRKGQGIGILKGEKLARKKRPLCRARIGNTWEVGWLQRASQQEQATFKA